MSNFVTRIETALEEVRGRSHVYPRINARDLEELLRHFKSMDAKERMHYPPHVEMLVEAAAKVARYYDEQGGAVALADLRQALNYAKPDWRTAL